MGFADLSSLFSAFCLVATACVEHPCGHPGSGLGQAKSRFVIQFPDSHQDWRFGHLCADGVEADPALLALGVG